MSVRPSSLQYFRKTVLGWDPKLLLECARDLKGPAHELSWLKARLQDTAVERVTHLSKKYYLNSIGDYVRTFVRGGRPAVDVDVGVLRRENGILYQNIDSLKAWERVGLTESNIIIDKVLPDMRDFIMRSPSREPMRCRVLIEGEARGLAEAQPRITATTRAINAELETARLARRARWRPKVVKSVLLVEAIPITGAAGMIRHAPNLDSNEILDRTPDYPADAVCKHCGDRMVNLTTLFPCAAPDGHNWEDAGTVTDAITKLVGGTVAVQHCRTANHYKVRGIVAESPDYEHDQKCMARLNKAWHLLNIDRVTHQYEQESDPSKTPIAVCTVCGFSPEIDPGRRDIGPITGSSVIR